ncbi:phosphate ABC transporter ATP-binding protein [Parabacteroides sp. Marseille-P3160]|uniref:phosphate ABC transporter ATP-binding protein n=1 Tax=Parabacteroides sp. Marseille-P3160 TaxID=1917887 RepID=UPI0009BBAF03|nr:phosphate ABC transporter ATP-binding protein [Parabacteroides sp. Marseille-P3160]
MSAVHSILDQAFRSIPFIHVKKELATDPDNNERILIPDHKGNSSIKISHLNVRIKDNHILKDINLEIPDRKITCIIGPSGCGKSTLLKTINRLIDDVDNVKVDGRIWVDGEDIYDRKVEITHIRKKLGLLSQRPTPLPMSIYDNITYGCKIHGVRNKKRLGQIVEFNLKAAGLWEEVKDRLHTPASSLSIGQQQRLCLARGLAVEPQFILGDEATSALDPISSRHIEDMFLKLKEKYGIILVTHTLRQALRIADHVVFVYLGEIIETGSADQVFNNPKNELTKQYLSGVFS